VIIVTIFFDYLSVMMIDPIVIQVISNSTIFQKTNYNFWVIGAGILFGIYSIGQFITAPFLGTLSERYGRKPVLVFSLLGTVFARLLFIGGLLLSSFWIILLSRFIDGITGGNISAAEAAIADISDESNLDHNFRISASAVALGLALGPIVNIASYYTLSSYFPGFQSSIISAIAALGLSVFNLLLLALLFGETLKRKTQEVRFHLEDINIISKISKLGEKKKLFFLVFIFTFGFWLASYLKLYIPFQLNYSSNDDGSYINLAYLYVGFWLVVSQQFILRKYDIRLKGTLINFISICILGGVILLSFSLPINWDEYFYVKYIILASGASLFAIGYGAVYPIFNSWLCEKDDYVLSTHSKTGEILGISTSMNALSQGLAPILAGLLATYSISTPIVAGLILMAFSIFYLYFNSRRRF